MNTLTIKISAVLENELGQLSERELVTKSELVRRALHAYIAQQSGVLRGMSALDKAGDIVGCFSGGPTDLSSNPAHLQGFGDDSGNR